MMVVLKLSHIIFTLFLYRVKFASSEILYLDNLDNPNFYTIKIVEDRLTKIMILSTPEDKITEIRSKRKLIWGSDRGEYVKCFTRFSFESSDKTLITIEIGNAVDEAMKFIYVSGNFYKYINKSEFEDYYKSFCSVFIKIPPGKLPIPRLKKNVKTEKVDKRKLKRDRQRKDKPQSEQHDKNVDIVSQSLAEEGIDLEKKIVGREEPTQQTEKQQEPTELEPETIPVELESDDEEIDESNVSKPKESDGILTQNRYTQTDIQEIEDIGIQTEIHELENIVTQTDIQTKESSIQTDIQEVEDIDTQTDIQELENIGIQTIGNFSDITEVTKKHEQPEVPKRRPGRPRKQKPEPEQPKRKRGRPRKQKYETKKTWLLRPRNMKTETKKTWLLRPRKQKPEPEQPKRKRGRPRKQKYETKKTWLLRPRNMKTETKKTWLLRPRKHKPEPEQPKRKRGRPRKQKPEPSSDT
uniref:TashAT1 protein n=2 Tax=Theileria annulata TaxID=5874 RepID=Q9BLN1_THEAN|nr:TashAT1 protein [Theileria annulata]